MPSHTDRLTLSARIRWARLQSYGEDTSRLARALGIPVRTWENYERGVIMPGQIALGFVCLTGVDPGWLLTGKEPAFPGPFQRE